MQDTELLMESAVSLLSGADCLILAERCAALDPETLHQALPGVLERALTLLVIAHPGGMGSCTYRGRIIATGLSKAVYVVGTRGS